jgi:hypothetical protein
MFDTTFRSAAVIDFDVIVVIKIASILESNNCFIAIATYISQRVAVVDAFLPAGTFARQRLLAETVRRLE